MSTKTEEKIACPSVSIKKAEKILEVNLETQFEFGKDTQTSKPYIVGIPGTGKTEFVKSLCIRKGYRLISRQCSNMPMEQFSGCLTNKVKSDGSAEWTRPVAVSVMDSVVYCPPNWNPENGRTVIALDDTHTLDKASQKYLFEMLCSHRINGFSLPDNCAIVLMGNDISHKAGAISLNCAIINRMVIINVRPDLKDWLKDFAYPNGIDKRVIGFLNQREEAFVSSVCAENTQMNTPRSWTNISRMLSVMDSKNIVLDSEQLQQLVCGTIGNAIGVEFCNYIEYYSEWNIQKDIRRKDLCDYLTDKFNDNPLKAWSFTACLFDYLNKWCMDKSITAKEKENEIAMLYDALTKAFMVKSEHACLQPLIISGFRYISDYFHFLDDKERGSYLKSLRAFMKGMHRKKPEDWALYGLTCQFFDIKMDDGDEDEIKKAYEILEIDKNKI